SSSSLLM
ncbi:hypothetical protein D030_2416B, partial [Vibrio parahaemolyticus AQ3810]